MSLIPKTAPLSRTENALAVGVCCLLPLHLYLTVSNLFRSIDHGSGHSYPLRAYVLLAVYLLVLLAVDAYLALRRRFVLAAGLSRYFGACCGITAAMLFAAEILDYHGTWMLLGAVATPYIVLLPLLEKLFSSPLAIQIAMEIFCACSWAACRYLPRQTEKNSETA